MLITSVSSPLCFGNEFDDDPTPDSGRTSNLSEQSLVEAHFQAHDAAEREVWISAIADKIVLHQLLLRAGASSRRHVDAGKRPLGRGITVALLRSLRRNCNASAANMQESRVRVNRVLRNIQSGSSTGSVSAAAAASPSRPRASSAAMLLAGEHVESAEIREVYNMLCQRQTGDARKKQPRATAVPSSSDGLTFDSLLAMEELQNGGDR